MFKVLLSGAAAGLVAAGAAGAAPAVPAAPAWLITPAESTCQVDIELAGRSGAVVPASLVSDGRAVELAFTKEDPPERAFLPIRVNQKAYSNLVVRFGQGHNARMILSDETVSALRKGGVLQIGWLAQEPVSVALSGSDQALTDLRACGAQVSAQHAQRQAALADAQARAESEARERQLAAEQLAVVRAQREAAEAERERQAAEAERERALAAAEQRRLYDMERRRIYEAEQARLEDEASRWPPPPPPPRYGGPRPYYGYRPY